MLFQRSPTTARTYSRLGRSLKPRPSLLSAASSYSDISTSRRSEADEAMQSGLAMMRSASVTSMDLRASSPAVVSYPETSAHHHMRLGKVFIDFSVVAPEDEAGKTWPVSWSVNNVLVFGRGNRVHYKNLAVNEDVAQLCKLKDNHGDLRLLECGGKDQANVVAAGTSTGHIQMWDLATKKNTGSWQVNGATAMKWNGQQLTVGLQKGAIKHYDTRAPKIKDSVKKVTRHQAKITSLAWNTEGRYYASGDETGTVFVWDIRQNGIPLEDLGDMIQRRRKIQHSGAVTVRCLNPATLCPPDPLFERPSPGARGSLRFSPPATLHPSSLGPSASGPLVVHRLFITPVTQTRLRWMLLSRLFIFRLTAKRFSALMVQDR